MEKKFELLLKEAVFRRASDIHFEIKDNLMSIDFRINGKLEKPDGDYLDLRLLRYLRYLANLDIANSLKPETGTFVYLIDDTLYSLRFAYIKNGSSEIGVLRILNGQNDLKPEDLTPYKSDVLFLKEILEEENGLILLCGATGSGKTTSLYTLLKSVTGKKIYTVEDPVEIYIDEFVQFQVNEIIGFDYNAAIKQIMRHDPDIIMIGEIRDEIAAKAAIRAANTGHLVVSTIHASNSKMAINRMLDLGIDKHNLSDVLIACMYQKLFSKVEGGKAAIYEKMDRKELSYYFQNGTTSKDFIPIQTKIDIAIKYRAILPK